MFRWAQVTAPAVKASPPFSRPWAHKRASASPLAKGFYGRLIKQNWSVPIYQQMIKNLEQPQRDGTGSVK
jgi:hypothetical protein